MKIIVMREGAPRANAVESFAPGWINGKQSECLACFKPLDRLPGHSFEWSAVPGETNHHHNIRTVYDRSTKCLTKTILECVYLLPFPSIRPQTGDCDVHVSFT